MAPASAEPSSSFARPRRNSCPIRCLSLISSKTWSTQEGGDGDGVERLTVGAGVVGELEAGGVGVGDPTRHPAAATSATASNTAERPGRPDTGPVSHAAPTHPGRGPYASLSGEPLPRGVPGHGPVVPGAARDAQ